MDGWMDGCRLNHINMNQNHITKYFYVSCTFNNTTAMTYYKQNIESFAMIIERKNGLYPSNNEIKNEICKQIVSINNNICIREPFIIMACNEWSKEQYDAFVS